MSSLAAFRRPLGSTGLSVSPLGLGTVKFGRNQGVKYPTTFDLPDDKQAANLLALARDSGINLLDTAPAYGSSETRLGQLLSGQRQHWVICTKAGEEFSDGQSQYDFSAAHIRFSVERSLQRLHTDYLDIVLLHSDGNDEHILRQQDSLQCLLQLQQEGKIRAVGLSGKTVAGGLLAAQLGDCVMVTHNRQYQGEQAVLDYCAANHKGAIIKKAFASGHLGPEPDAAKRSIEFVLAHPGVSSIIVGTVNPAHLAANITAAASWLQRHTQQ